ncbi:MAG: LTA synthase family protein [Candidatus Omnitrophica bacterium]|nr:LTA synthase family protein [Candidatus Omnitrophota bacterium]
MKSKLSGILKVKLLVPLISTTLIYISLQLFIELVYSLNLICWGLFFDWLAQVIIAYLLFGFARRIFLFIILQAVFLSFIYLGNALKLSILGAPLTIDDIFSFSALYHVLNFPQKCLLVGPFILIPGLFFFNLKIHKKKSFVCLGVVIILALILRFNPHMVVNFFISKYAFQSWNQINNYRISGATIYLIYNSAQFFSERLKAPDKGQVDKAIRELGFLENKQSEIQKKEGLRNVVVILMESLWDPLLLKNIKFSDDPFASGFRELWNKSGNSFALTSVYGGLTANPEFEILTGHPANLYDKRILFQTTVKNKVPGLAAYLKEFGYESVVLHPYIPSFWNRVNAYNRLGFDFYYSIGDFELDDMNNWTLSDESLYRQSMDILKEKHAQDAPKFTYIITLTGHWPFLLNEQKRPPIIRTSSKIKEVNRYANLIRYNTAEAMNFISTILKEDPHALLVILGDHLPPLGKKFQPYVESGLLTSSVDNFDAKMLRNYVSTPLIIINGQEGPVKVQKKTPIVKRLSNGWKISKCWTGIF